MINGNVVKSVKNYRTKSYKNLNLLAGSACRYEEGIQNSAPVDVDSEYFNFENLVWKRFFGYRNDADGRRQMHVLYGKIWLQIYVGEWATN